MDERGVYAIARSLWDCDTFTNQKFTQREAWLWLIGAAVWKQTRINLDGRRVVLERGEFAFSLRFLAKKWKWSKDAVSRFFLLLKNEDMIRDANRDSVKVYSIIKYNEFQVVGLPKRDSECDAERDTRETAPRQPRDKEEALKHSSSISIEPVEKKSPAPEPLVLPDWLDREAWAAFLDLRTKKKAPNTHRALKIILKKLGKWHGMGRDPTAILDASTVNGWKDLYEPKDGQHGQRTNTARTATDQHLSGIIDLRNEIRSRSFGS
jgi:hypothetical protein